jgi:hypothetical protein
MYQARQTTKREQIITILSSLRLIHSAENYNVAFVFLSNSFYCPATLL